MWELVERGLLRRWDVTVSDNWSGAFLLFHSRLMFHSPNTYRHTYNTNTYVFIPQVTSGTSGGSWRAS